MSNFLNYKNDHGINPFNDLDEWYIDATFEELRLGLIPFDLSNRLKEMFARIQIDIQTIPTKVSELENDSGFITASDVDISTKTDKGGYTGTSQDLKALIDDKLDIKMSSLSNALTVLEQNSIKTKLNITAVDISSKENTVNKSTDIEIDKASNIKFPSVKSVYDWVISKLSFKQNTLIQGVGINIIGDTISATSIPHLEYDNDEKTVWNNGFGNIQTNSSWGDGALRLNTSGNSNTTSGYQSMRENTTGSSNTSDGIYALSSNTTGSFNTAIGRNALQQSTTGSFNTAIGRSAGMFIFNAITPLTTVSNSIFIGALSRALLDNSTNEIVIGHDATGKGSNTVTIGNNQVTDTFIKGKLNISQYTTALRPPYVKGSLIFDSTLNKLVVGGATDWEVITST